MLRTVHCDCGAKNSHKVIKKENLIESSKAEDMINKPKKFFFFVLLICRMSTCSIAVNFLTIILSVVLYRCHSNLYIA